eukprot:CAMPEP_0173432570 /NCGR_PEP_ID=MMETSP1357-20121228/10329_1 /TAXON_ID=77926 /ORGANISM="Hemiselmis rufescens, Strain PCC563" /LENGTH=55 /DNA_ID=CAMNT_0014397187 /DNA_START=138 /DNA_END=305 /DNA_ORIENTATION=-
MTPPQLLSPANPSARTYRVQHTYTTTTPTTAMPPQPSTASKGINTGLSTQPTHRP